MRAWVLAALAVLIFAGGAWGQSEESGERDVDILLEHALKPWTGDFEGMKKRGFVRVGVAHNPLLFAFDGKKRIGLAVERSRALEKHLSKVANKRITVILMPGPRDKLLPALAAGKVDLIDANLTITEERRKSVEFSLPLQTGVSEIVVTSAAMGDLTSFDQLKGHPLFLRQSSSYWSSVARINGQRKTEGKEPLAVSAVEEVLEDYDVLELIQAGIVDATIVDDHKANLWAQVFDGIKLQEKLSVNTDGEIAYAMRQNSREMKKVVDGFVKTVRERTKLGNILNNRYLKSTSWIKKVSPERRMRLLREVMPHFKTYSGKYDFDWLLIAAQGYQESGFEQSKRSPVGAVGIMQVMPDTAKDPVVGIPNIHESEANIHAGIKYLHFLRERYFNDPAIDDFNQVLFSLAAYNAGPGNMRKSRARAEKMGLDPNIWFGNVEIATAKAVSSEPVIYVRNIFKYAVDIRLSEHMLEARDAAASDIKKESEAK
jgi:membrane-bound lytic murein transglycosylase MltF